MTAPNDSRGPCAPHRGRKRGNCDDIAASAWKGTRRGDRMCLSRRGSIVRSQVPAPSLRRKNGHAHRAGRASWYSRALPGAPRCVGGFDWSSPLSETRGGRMLRGQEGSRDDTHGVLLTARGAARSLRPEEARGAKAEAAPRRARSTRARTPAIVWMFSRLSALSLIYLIYDVFFRLGTDNRNLINRGHAVPADNFPGRCGGRTSRVVCGKSYGPLHRRTPDSRHLLPILPGHSRAPSSPPRQPRRRSLFSFTHCLCALFPRLPRQRSKATSPAAAATAATAATIQVGP
jgi:hypothetical protein